MVRTALIFLALLMPAFAFSQQQGCTDTAALNYNREAVINDGSCIYKPLSVKPPVLIKKLPKKVFETSGLIWWRGSYWTHNFDCEALIGYGDSLYLFSKNWADHKCRLYAMPKDQGHYILYPAGEFNADGLITGAAIDQNANQMVLCGYKNYLPFVWILSDFVNSDFFGGNKRRVDFKELPATQTEGVTCIREGVYSISAERTKVNRAKIFLLDLNEIP